MNEELEALLQQALPWLIAAGVLLVISGVIFWNVRRFFMKRAHARGGEDKIA